MRVLYTWEKGCDRKYKTEVRKILRHLCKIGRAPPGVKMADLEIVIL